VKEASPIRVYAPWEAGLVVAGSTLGQALSGLRIGMALWLAALIYACVRDWPGIATEQGHIQLDDIPGAGRALLITGYIVCFPVYDVQIVVVVVRVFRQAHIDAPVIHQR
jgi:hypothetical protein